MTGFVVNPASGFGRTARLWPRIAERLGHYFHPFAVRLTAAPGEATRLACELLQAGAKRIVAVGGDGTVHEVANSGCACFGVLPAGSADDFARMIGVPHDWETALPWLAEAEEVTMDLGLATFHSEPGIERSRYFVNMAGFGLGGRVVRRRHIPYLLAAVAELAGDRPVELDLTLDGVALHVAATHVSVGNGRYQGNGMILCPNAQLDDGLLDVTVIAPVGVLELAVERKRLYDGTILEHPKVRPHLVRTLGARSGRPVAVELDGEPVGYLPLAIEVVPEAARVLVRG